MGIYNPLAKMPDNCAVCKEKCGHRNITAHKRHKRCPLVEVKTPHGRLIDADREISIITKIIEDNALKESMWNEYDSCRRTLITAPTVIETEGE